MGKFDELIGREWPSIHGTRRVTGVREVGGQTRLEVQTGDTNIRELLPPDELEREIKLDTSRVTSRAAAKAELAAADDEYKRLPFDDKGFIATFRPMQAARVATALRRGRNYRGQTVPVGVIVTQLVKDGFRVQIAKNGERRLAGADGAFFDEKALTKWGLDFAEHLARKDESMSKHYMPAVRSRLDEMDPVIAIGALGSLAVGGAIGAGAVKAWRTIKDLLAVGKKSAAEKTFDALSKSEKAALRMAAKRAHEGLDEYTGAPLTMLPIPSDTLTPGEDTVISWPLQGQILKPGERYVPHVERDAGWLVRNYESIRSFTVERAAGDNANLDCVVIGHTDRNEMVAVGFESKALARAFLERPCFDGKHVTWFGAEQTIGESPEWNYQTVMLRIDEMAKLSARGRTELLRMSLEREVPGDDLISWERTTEAYMSDGRVLKKRDVKFLPDSYRPEGRRHTYGWKDDGRMKPDLMKNPAALRAALQKLRDARKAKGWSIEADTTSELPQSPLTGGGMSEAREGAYVVWMRAKPHGQMVIGVYADKGVAKQARDANAADGAHVTFVSGVKGVGSVREWTKLRDAQLQTYYKKLGASAWGVADFSLGDSGDMDEGRTSTPPLVYELFNAAGGAIASPAMAWRVSGRGANNPGMGKPTEANLKKAIDDYNASLEGDGANDHLVSTFGMDRVKAVGGIIRRNEGRDSEILARYGKLPARLNVSEAILVEAERTVKLWPDTIADVSITVSESVNEDVRRIPVGKTTWKIQSARPGNLNAPVQAFVYDTRNAATVWTATYKGGEVIYTVTGGKPQARPPAEVTTAVESMLRSIANNVGQESVNEADLRVANTIIAQLGGNKFRAMTGSKNFVGSDKGVTFQIGSNDKGVNRVRITLEASDTYTVEFLSVRGTTVNVKAKVEDVYADMLQDVFTRHTGLYTSLGTMGRQSTDEATDTLSAVRKVLVQNPGRAFSLKQLAMAVSGDESAVLRAASRLVNQGTASYSRGEGYSLAGSTPGALKLATTKPSGARVGDQRTYDYTQSDAEKARKRKARIGLGEATGFAVVRGEKDALEYWTGDGWTSDKAEAKFFETKDESNAEAERLASEADETTLSGAVGGFRSYPLGKKPKTPINIGSVPDDKADMDDEEDESLNEARGVTAARVKGSAGWKAALAFRDGKDRQVVTADSLKRVVATVQEVLDELGIDEKRLASPTRSPILGDPSPFTVLDTLIYHAAFQPKAWILHIFSRFAARDESRDEGAETCAGCGEPWPCSDSKRRDISGRERAKHYVARSKDESRDEDLKVGDRVVYGPDPETKGFKRRDDQIGTVVKIHTQAGVTYAKVKLPSGKTLNHSTDSFTKIEESMGAGDTSIEVVKRKGKWFVVPPDGTPESEFPDRTSAVTAAQGVAAREHYAVVVTIGEARSTDEGLDEKLTDFQIDIEWQNGRYYVTFPELRGPVGSGYQDEYPFDTLPEALAFARQEALRQNFIVVVWNLKPGDTYSANDGAASESAEVLETVRVNEAQVAAFTLAAQAAGLPDDTEVHYEQGAFTVELPSAQAARVRELLAVC